MNRGETMESATFSIHLDDIVIDCPDAEACACFYAGLLGWNKLTLFPGVMQVSAEGYPLRLLIVQEEDHMPPVWPEADGQLQKQMHLDFTVSDLQAAVTKAKALGATESAQQYNPKQWITMLDPAGHPFCLCLPE
jgi:catechol 2,3-dioxygenase-like lactoylglutathione lyase family enzyme